MKMRHRILCVLTLVCLMIGCFGGASAETVESVDYAGQVELNMVSNSAKQEVTVKTFIDGDTTHFFVPETVSADGVLKARYLAVNTPEVTGKIEEYGKRLLSLPEKS